VNRLVLSAALALVLAACGGGGNDDGGGGGTTGTTTGGTTTGGTTSGGTTGGGTSGGGGSSTGGGAPSPTSCQNDFTPARVAAGENCDPALNRTKFCPLVSGLDLLTSRTSVIPCDGVEVTSNNAAGGGMTTQYLAIRPAGGGTPSAIYMALHYLNANTSYYANLIRMSELAKARNVLVLVPQAPGDGGLLTLPLGLPSPNTGLLSRWPTMVNEAVENNLQLLDGVVADARNRFSAGSAPLYVAGLSNGTPMAYFYGCGRADRVEAVLAVAGTQTAEAAAICRPNRPVGLVIVHGTSDLIVPYNGFLGLTRPVADNYADFKTYDQCTGADQMATLTGSNATVRFSYATNCAGGRRVVLATAVGNGHNWPGDDAGVLQESGFTIGLFGPALDGIDATIQGFDLLRYTAGN